MRDLYKSAQLLVWMTQFGFSVAGPLVICIVAAVWLQRHFSLGGWVVLAGVALGVGGAVSGLRSSMQAMRRQAEADEKEPPKPTDPSGGHQAGHK